MKLCTFVNRGQDRIGVVDEKYVFDLCGVQALAEKLKGKWPGLSRIMDEPFPERMIDFLEMGEKALDGARRAVEFARTYSEQGDMKLLAPSAVPIDEVVWRTPIPNNAAVWCIGGNSPNTQRVHGTEPTDYPFGFLKPTTGLRGHMEPVEIPEFYNWYRWTPELGVVLGRKARNVSFKEAMDYVIGFTCCNDMASQFHYPQYTERDDLHYLDRMIASYHGKAADGFMPIGPWITTKDEVGDCYDLNIYGRESGLHRDRGHTCALVLGPEQIINVLSQYMALPAGTIISLGAMHIDGLHIYDVVPEGGYMEVDIDRVGVLRNPIIDRRPHYRD